MTELIVALDLEDRLEAHGLMLKLREVAGVRWFKVGLESAADPAVVAKHASLFLDLKAYGTGDTIRAWARRCAGLGASMVSVCDEPRMLSAARGCGLQVLAVSQLTDRPWSSFQPHHRWVDGLARADGLVCPLPVARWVRGTLGLREGTLVCPGIRPLLDERSGPEHDHERRDNHDISVVSTPEEARGVADYIVVGRPVYLAPDPVAAARAIMEALL